MRRQLIRTQEIVTLDAERRVLRGGGILVAYAAIEQVLSREEVAALVVFLCSPLADGIHGQNIRVDGGSREILT